MFFYLETRWLTCWVTSSGLVSYACSVFSLASNARCFQYSSYSPMWPCRAGIKATKTNNNNLQLRLPAASMFSPFCFGLQISAPGKIKRYYFQDASRSWCRHYQDRRQPMSKGSFLFDSPVMRRKPMWCLLSFLPLFVPEGNQIV